MVGNKGIRGGILIILFVLYSTVFAQDDSTTLPPDGNIVLVTSAFVRSGPADNYQSVGAVFQGDLVTPLNISADGNWVLIIYSRRTAWIQRSLVRWENDAFVSRLPVLPADVTPTPRFPITNTPFVPTFTPEGNYVDVEGAESVYVRGGPGRGYLRLGQLLPGDTVEPVSRNEDTTWIMIRFTNAPLTDTFGWVATDLVAWEDIAALEDLPVVDIDSLTPTVTATGSLTPTPNTTTTDQASLPEEDVDLAEATAIIPTRATNTATVPATASATMTATLTQTSTPRPSQTATDTPSSTATDTETNTPTAIATDTETPTPTETATTEPEQTEALAAVAAAVSATATTSPTRIPTETPTPTITETPTLTATPPVTPTETPPPTDVFALQGTNVALEATQVAADTGPVSPLDDVNAPDVFAIVESLPVEAIVGIALLIGVLVYMWFYFQGLVAAGRYSDGFIIETCPVCRRGELSVESRPLRIVGIPVVRRTVRCDVCRSILRETGTRRWRYAVDRLEDLRMYNQFNGREVTDSDLERLAKMPQSGSSSQTSPTFVDISEDESP